MLVHSMVLLDTVLMMVAIESLSLLAVEDPMSLL